MEQMIWLMTLTVVGALIGFACGWLAWGQHRDLWNEEQVLAYAAQERAAERERILRDVAGLHMAQSVNNQNYPNDWHDGVDAALAVIRGA